MLRSHDILLVLPVHGDRSYLRQITNLNSAAPAVESERANWLLMARRLMLLDGASLGQMRLSAGR
jgi:hypothetical protein